MIAIRTAEVLLIEDNPGDVRLAREALKEGRVDANINVVGDGMEAMDFLLRRGRFSSAPRPDLILLDLNLPRKNGHAVLAEIKQDVGLRRIPVIVLSTSRADQDIVRSYDLHANAYVAKPVNLDEFLAVVEELSGFWLSIVRLPPK